MNNPNEIALCENSEFPESLEEFERNYDKKHPGSPGCFHNIYHLVAEDREGNIVDEAFGVNCITDLGFSNSFLRYYSSSQSGKIPPISRKVLPPRFSE